MRAPNWDVGMQGAGVLLVWVPDVPSPHWFGVEYQARNAAHEGPQLVCWDAGGRRAEPALPPR